MSNIPITSRVTVSLLGVFLQTRSLQVDGGSPSLWTSQQGWSDMQPLLKVHGSHFLSLAANLAFPAFPLSSWISLPVKRFLSEDVNKTNSIKIRIFYFQCHTSHPRSSLQYQCSTTQNIWITTSLAKDHSQFLPLSQRPWPAAPRTPLCSSSWCPCTARAAVQMPSCPGLQMIILIRMLRCRKSNKKVCKIVLKRHPKVVFVFVFVFVFQRCVKLFLHATLTLSFAATVAALSRKLTFSIKRVFSGLETWVRGWQEPARQSTRLVSPERLKCRPFF